MQTDRELFVRLEALPCEAMKKALRPKNEELIRRILGRYEAADSVGKREIEHFFETDGPAKLTALMRGFNEN